MTIGCNASFRSAVRHSRRVAFGRAQHPGLTDYADDVDTMRFLGTI